MARHQPCKKKKNQCYEGPVFLSLGVNYWVLPVWDVLWMSFNLQPQHNLPQALFVPKDRLLSLASSASPQDSWYAFWGEHSHPKLPHHWIVSDSSSGAAGVGSVSLISTAHPILVYMAYFSSVSGSSNYAQRDGALASQPVEDLFQAREEQSVPWVELLHSLDEAGLCLWAHQASGGLSE